MAHPAAVVEILGGLKGAVQPARIYILSSRSCKYWRDVEFRVYFKRFIWRESKRSEKQFRSLRCLFLSAGAPKNKTESGWSPLPRCRCSHPPPPPPLSLFFTVQPSSSSKKLQVILNNNRHFVASFFQGQEIDVPPVTSSSFLFLHRHRDFFLSSSSSSAPFSSSSPSSSSVSCLSFFSSPPRWLRVKCQWRRSSHVCLSEWLHLGSLGRR